jgi:hypothetical protein
MNFYEASSLLSPRHGSVPARGPDARRTALSVGPRAVLARLVHQTITDLEEARVLYYQLGQGTAVGPGSGFSGTCSWVITPKKLQPRLDAGSPELDVSVGS